MQGNAVIAEGRAEQASEVVAVVRIQEDRAFVDAALRDVQRDTWQFETRPSGMAIAGAKSAMRCYKGTARSVGGHARCR